MTLKDINKYVKTVIVPTQELKIFFGEKAVKKYFCRNSKTA